MIEFGGIANEVIAGLILMFITWIGTSIRGALRSNENVRDWGELVMISAFVGGGALGITSLIFYLGAFLFRFFKATGFMESLPFSLVVILNVVGIITFLVVFGVVFIAVAQALVFVVFALGLGDYWTGKHKVRK